MLCLGVMTTGSILLALALLVLVGLFVVRPFLLPRRRPVPLTERQALLAEKVALLAKVQALDFDLQTGKQEEEVYTIERRLLMERAGDILRRLDELGAGEDDIETQIAAAVAKLRRPAAAGKNFCPQCGEKTMPDDKFCSSCGEKLR